MKKGIYLGDVLDSPVNDLDHSVYFQIGEDYKDYIECQIETLDGRAVLQIRTVYHELQVLPRNATSVFVRVIPDIDRIRERAERILRDEKNN